MCANLCICPTRLAVAIYRCTRDQGQDFKRPGTEFWTVSLPRRVTWLSNVMSAEKIGFEDVARSI
ncbi:MAG: hypothetical protein ACYDAK_14135, partial [Candidatus Limnocylindrales bacterium]